MNGNAAPPPAFNANDAVNAYEALTTVPLKNDAVEAKLELTAFNANDAVNAYEEETADVALPESDPVKPDVAITLPVICT